MMSKYGICWLHPCTYSREKQVLTDHKFITHFEKTVSSSSHFRESAGKPAAVFSHKRKSSQETLSDRESISSGHRPLQGKGETFVRFSDPEEAARCVLEEQRDHPLAEAKMRNLNS